MAYKDKEEQREADRARQKRRRDRVKAKGVTSEGVTQGVTSQGSTQYDRDFAGNLTKEGISQYLKDHPKQESGTQKCQVVKAEDRAGYIEPCMRPGYVCPIPEDQRKPGINYGPYMTANELAAAGLKANKVSVPGDDDYNGICNPPPLDHFVHPTARPGL